MPDIAELGRRVRPLADDLFLPIDEVAKKLYISRRTVFRMMARGELERVKIGRRTLVTRASLLVYLRKYAYGELS